MDKATLDLAYWNAYELMEIDRREGNVTVWRTRVSAGMLVRGTFVRNLRDECITLGLVLSIQETKRFLDSDYDLYVQGTPENIQILYHWMRGWSI